MLLEQEKIMIEELKEILSNYTIEEQRNFYEYGIKSGVIREFIYYKDIYKFFNKHIEAIFFYMEYLSSFDILDRDNLYFSPDEFTLIVVEDLMFKILEGIK